MFNKLITAILLNIGCIAAFGQQKSIDARVDSVLRLMTLEEKAGQLNQYSGREVTGPVTSKQTSLLEEIRKGHVGSMLNVKGVKDTREVQQVAMQSRLKIPLIFGLDVIHGYHVTFPLPLAEAASWDLDAIERSARIAAIEAAASGIHWTFAPMVDVSRDPRWGRVMEGAGEDTYLGSLIAKARVHGFQGRGIGDPEGVMACAKHFAAYGAAIAGRDYNSVDMSKRMLYEVYLPPFKAAVDAGAATFMNSFNDLNGIPATGNSFLQRDILKKDWNYQGFIVSDWGSIGEMVAHGYAKDKKDAAQKAILAGNDMDMETSAYREHLADLVKEGKVPESVVDEAVRRVLKMKFQLGLFDDPYKFCNERREKNAINTVASNKAALDMARKSIVLLKNQGDILPLSRSTKKIALIGPLVKSKTDMKGFWSVDVGQENELISLYEGMQNKVGKKGTLLYAKGCNINDADRSGFNEAVAAAKEADVVVMAVGETFNMSGEAKSRADIGIPGVQEDLIRAVKATGKPLVVLIMAGRPLVFNYTADNVPAILYTWWLGTQAGNAIADVLYGDYTPSGKIPMSFPRSVGQIPVYYNYYNTGRPVIDPKNVLYKSAYIDISNTPQYAFGYGLSYTTFKYDQLKLDKTAMGKSDSITVSFRLTNTGKYAGEEVVQVYLRDLVAQPLRPVKELKDFKKVMLKPGENKELKFVINKDKLSFYNEDLQKITQPGSFRLMIGSASDDIRLESEFELLD